jgi:antitoxin component YwqK of YwqJK toxin-antitoxin module
MRSGILLSLIWLSLTGPKPATHVTEFWPNGHLRRAFDVRDDMREGEYRTFTIEGKPYELKHFLHGREDGLQQAWDDRGQLYLNYVVKNGRRYGMINAKPCLPAAADGTSTR